MKDLDRQVEPDVLSENHLHSANHVGGTSWRGVVELGVMVGALQLDAWWADLQPSELPSNLLKALVPLIWWISYQRRKRAGVLLPPATVKPGRAWLEAGLFTLLVAGIIILSGEILREPYDAVRYPVGEGARTQVAWISSRLGRALFQQSGLQLFVWPVVRELVGGGMKAVSLTAGVFALLHVPYPLLVGTTFVLGWVWVCLYRRGRRLLPLVLSHAILAMVVFAVLPDWVNHNLHVGEFEVERAPAYRRLGSPEVRDTLREVTSEGYYLRQGGEDRAWVSAVFETLVDRHPDPGEIDEWTMRLGQLSRTEVAKKLILERVDHMGASPPH